MIYSWCGTRLYLMRKYSFKISRSPVTAAAYSRAVPDAVRSYTERPGYDRVGVIPKPRFLLSGLARSQRHIHYPGICIRLPIRRCILTACLHGFHVTGQLHRQQGPGNPGPFPLGDIITERDFASLYNTDTNKKQGGTQYETEE